MVVIYYLFAECQADTGTGVRLAVMKSFKDRKNVLLVFFFKTDPVILYQDLCIFQCAVLPRDPPFVFLP